MEGCEECSLAFPRVALPRCAYAVPLLFPWNCPQNRSKTGGLGTKKGSAIAHFLGVAELCSPTGISILVFKSPTIEHTRTVKQETARPSVFTIDSRILKATRENANAMSSSVLMASPTSPPSPHFAPPAAAKPSKAHLLSFLYELLCSIVYLPSKARTAPAPPTSAPSSKSHPSFQASAKPTSSATSTPPATPPPSPFSSSTGFSRGSPGTTGSVRALTRNPAPSKPLLRLKKKTLVLDLDETLIHSTSLSSRREPYDFRAEVRVNEHIILYYVYKRPHVDLFLSKVSLAPQGARGSQGKSHRRHCDPRIVQECWTTVSV